MNKLAASVLALGCLAAPATAAAQTVIYAPWGVAPPVVYVAPQVIEAEPPPPQDATRFRFGIGGNLTLAMAEGRRVNAGSFGAGLTLDLGAQVNRHLAVYVHGVASTMILTGQASLHGVVEWTPSDVISLGTGIGWQGVATVAMQYDAVGCCGSYDPPRNTWSGVSIPAIVGLNFGARPGANGRRKSFRLNLEGAFAIEPSTGISGWQTSIAFGYVAM